jgi:YVTN family beta-propeller protein
MSRTMCRLLLVGLLLAASGAPVLAAPFAYIGNYDATTITIVDVATDTLAATVTVPAAGEIVVAPDATRLYALSRWYNQPPGFNGCFVTVLDATSNTVIARVPVGQEASGVAVTPDGTRVYVTQHGTVVQPLLLEIDTATNTVARTKQISQWRPGRLAVAPDGTRLYVVEESGSIASPGGAVDVVDASTLTRIGGVGFSRPVSDIALTADGARLYVVYRGTSSTDPGTLAVVDTATIRVTATTPIGPRPEALALTADGTRLYVATLGDDTVAVVDTATLTAIATVPGSGSLALTPDGTRLYVVSRGASSTDPGTLAVVDTVTNAVTDTVPVGLGRPSIRRDAFGPRAFVNRGDFTGDWHSDLLWQQKTTGDLYLWGMTGTSVTAAGYLAQGLDLAWYVVGTGDLTGDGRPDLLWRHAGTGDLALWSMVGTVRTGEAILARGVEAAWQIVATADVNHDGQPDLLWQHATAGQVYVWYLDGLTVTAGGYLREDGDPAWRLAAAVDLDGNGLPDLVWQQVATGGVYAWYLDGQVDYRGRPVITRTAWLAEGQPAVQPGAGWSLETVVDLNQDGTPDLVWHHGTTGDVYVWLMNGTTPTAGSYIQRGVDLSWKLVGPR